MLQKDVNLNFYFPAAPASRRRFQYFSFPLIRSAENLNKVTLIPLTNREGCLYASASSVLCSLLSSLFPRSPHSFFPQKQILYPPNSRRARVVPLRSAGRIFLRLPRPRAANRTLAGARTFTKCQYLNANFSNKRMVRIFLNYSRYLPIGVIRVGIFSLRIFEESDPLINFVKSVSLVQPPVASRSKKR
jgi:hypothetical protein